MKIKLSLLFIALISMPTFASFINGDNYISNEKDIFWVNNDLSLDILRLNWSDTLGGKVEEQKTLAEIEAYVSDNQEGWRWATVAEFTDVVNWFDTDTNNVGWSVDQNIGTNLFIEINGFGSKYYGTGAGGEEYQSGYDHEGYTYWQFGTLLKGCLKTLGLPILVISLILSHVQFGQYTVIIWVIKVI